MIIGEKSEFAIELNIKEQASERWIYGTYFFWFGGTRLGDPNDAVDLRGCMNWLISFLDEENQVLSRYFTLDKREVFILLCASIYEHAIPEDLTNAESLLLEGRLSTDPYGSEANSYNFADYGMSSFNNIYMLAIDSKLMRRFIWQQKGGG